MELQLKYKSHILSVLISAKLNKISGLILPHYEVFFNVKRGTSRIPIQPSDEDGTEYTDPKDIVAEAMGKSWI
mgnify:CR=1 FL=1